MTHFPIMVRSINGSRRRIVGRLFDGVVAIWIATDYNVGNSISWSYGRRCQICRELFLSLSRRLALRNSLEQVSQLVFNEAKRVLENRRWREPLGAVAVWLHA